MGDRLDEFIERQMEQNPIEVKILRKVYDALAAAGTPITSVFDGVDDEPVGGTWESLTRLVFNLDECYLKTGERGWVRFIGGNEWDVICDYTLNHEAALQPVNDYIDKYN